MDASLKINRLVRVIVAGSAVMLAVACTNDNMPFQPAPQPEKVVVVKDHHCHHGHHHKHHKGRHHKGHHHVKHKAAEKTAAASQDMAAPAQ